MSNGAKSIWKRLNLSGKFKAIAVADCFGKDGLTHIKETLLPSTATWNTQAVEDQLKEVFENEDKGKAAIKAYLEKHFRDLSESDRSDYAALLLQKLYAEILCTAQFRLNAQIGT